MKNVLNDQSSEYDCGLTTLTNALGDEIGLFDPYAVHLEGFSAEKLRTNGIRIVEYFL